MRRMILSVAAVLAAAVPLGLWKAAPSGAEANGMQISRDDTRPATHGPAETFTGQVSVKALFDPNDARQFSSAQVSFTPCARTAWHTHPGGQTPGRHLGKRLGAGTGWPETGHRPGDVIWTPPGVKHWHGATEGEAMTHIAIQSVVDGQVVDWMEHVTDDQYLQ